LVKKPKERPVGEILKEEGVIKEEKEEERPATEKIDVHNVLMEVEKLRAIVDTLKTVKFDVDERIRELAEAIGEIRSLFFQRDAEIKEIGTKLERIEESVKDIKPEKMRKQLEERDRELNAVNAKLEKLEEMFKDLNQRLAKTEKILENIKSVENLKEIMEAVQEKLRKIEELKFSVERDAAKTERFYLESEKRIGEFQEMKEKISKIEELTKELVRSVDENRIKLDAAVTKQDLEKAIEEKLRIGKRKEEKIAEKEEEKKEIISLLKSIEEQYNKGFISHAAYSEIVEKNRAMLERLEDDIRRLKSEELPKDIGEMLEFLQEKMEELAAKMIVIEKKLTEEIKEKEIKLKEARREEEISPKKAYLTKKLKEAEELLSVIEDQYRKGIISEKTYEEVKSKNLEQIEKIKKELAMPEKVEVREDTILETVKKIVEHLSELEKLISTQNEKMLTIEKNVANLATRTSELEKILTRTSEIGAGDVQEKMEEVRKKIEEARRAISLF
jgi:chromosome segregation ATPase